MLTLSNSYAPSYRLLTRLGNANWRTSGFGSTCKGCREEQQMVIFPHNLSTEHSGRCFDLGKYDGGVLSSNTG